MWTALSGWGWPHPGFSTPPFPYTWLLMQAGEAHPSSVTLQPGPVGLEGCALISSSTFHSLFSSRDPPPARLSVIYVSTVCVAQQGWLRVFRKSLIRSQSAWRGGPTVRMLRSKEGSAGASLLVQGLRLALQMQGTRVPSSWSGN